MSKKIRLLLSDPRVRLLLLLFTFFVAEIHTFGEEMYVFGMAIAVFSAWIASRFCNCPNCGHFMGAGYSGTWVIRFFDGKCPHCHYVYQRGVVEDNKSKDT